MSWELELCNFRPDSTAENRTMVENREKGHMTNGFFIDMKLHSERQRH